jgi:2-polyprenyl-3-methyl-5-hydroxy-6-metoxy-1,4-benzoquinol methylase
MMQRFTWEEMRRYWEEHTRLRAPVDEDPEALSNVCHPGVPKLVNEYYARFQQQIYGDLVAALPAVPGARALDVGCGAGRWCKVLHERGFKTTGVDLQADLIERNRTRFPDITFECVAIQDYKTDETFDLVSSVTVLQHMPFDEQRKALTTMRRILREGGHAIILENVLEQGAHVFANSIEQWTALFADAGFSVLSLRKYDYSPALRFRRRMINLARSFRKRAQSPDPQSPDELFVSSQGAVKSLVPHVRGSLTAASYAAAAGVDSFLEPWLIRAQPHLLSVHCGWLLRAEVDPR